MKRIITAILLGLALTIPASIVTSSPAQADQSQDRQTVAVQLAEPNPVAPPTPQVSSGGCGWFQLCLYFNKSEQKYIGIATIAAITAFICGATALIGCAVAGTVAAVLAKYVDKHGICPSSKPRLRIKVFPTVSGEPQCVS